MWDQVNASCMYICTIVLGCFGFKETLRGIYTNWVRMCGLIHILALVTHSVACWELKVRPHSSKLIQSLHFLTNSSEWVSPKSKCRPWRYNDQVNEYFVITDDEKLHKRAETTKDVEENDLGESWSKSMSQPFHHPYIVIYIICVYNLLQSKCQTQF